MQILNLENPFHAPVFYVDRCGSTQNLAKALLPENPAPGTVITANYQDSGRGRGTNRLWSAKPGENLLFTIILRYEKITAIPRGLTLRTGLGVACGVLDFVPALAGHVAVKWPNDVMIDGRKICGILAESNGTYVYTGIGVNTNQLDFPPEIEKKAVSIRRALQDNTGQPSPELDKNRLLESILSGLHKYLSPEMDTQWKPLLESKLFRKGETVLFVPGQAGAGDQVEGILEGIGDDGELLIRTDQGIRSFITGELKYQYSL